MDKALRIFAVILLLYGTSPAQVLVAILTRHSSTTPTWGTVSVACSGNTGCPASSVLQSGTTANGTFSATLSTNSSIIVSIALLGTDKPTSVGCTGAVCTVVAPASCTTAHNATIGVDAYCSYVLNGPSGVTGCTVTFAGTESFAFVCLASKKSNGAGGTLDGTPANVSTTCSSCAGASLTLTGANDFEVRAPSNDAGQPTSSGIYTSANPNSTDLPNLAFYAINTTSGTMTWPYGSSQAFQEWAMALK